MSLLMRTAGLPGQRRARIGVLGALSDGPDPWSLDPYFDIPPTDAETATTTGPIPATITRTIYSVPPTQTGQQSGLEKTISQIALTVAQAFGKRPVYNSAAVGPGATTLGGSGATRVLADASGKGLGQDVGNTVGKLGDVVSVQAARLVSAHPLAVAGVALFVVYEMWRKTQGHRTR